jgi:hypothetical protein
VPRRVVLVLLVLLAAAVVAAVVLLDGGSSDRPQLVVPPLPTGELQAPPTFTAEELDSYLLNELVLRLYDGLSRMTGRINRDNCARPCELDLDFARNAEGSSHFCLSRFDAASFRQTGSYDAAEHEVLIASLEEVCSIVNTMEGDSPASRASAERAFVRLYPLVPAELR